MKKLPKVPYTAYSTLGPIPVVLVPDLKFDGEDALGSWNYNERIIKMRPEQPRTTAWQTFIHEKVHMWLSDAGISSTLTQKQEESICDAISTAILAEMLNA